MLGLGVLSRKEDSAPAEVYVLYLDPDKFADSTSEFINHLKHQLVIVIIYTIEKTLQFISGHIANNLAKTFVSFRAFALSAWNLSVRIIFVVDLHSNVKSAGLINVSHSVP